MSATHEVRIDDAAILAEFEAGAMGIAPGVPAVAAEAVNPAEAWQPVTRIAASLLANKLCPNWQVSAEVQADWAAALAECLEQVMPGGLGNIDAWGPWGKLAFASGMWVFAGFDISTMQLKPRYPQTEAEREAEQTNNSRGFSTDE